MTDAATRTSRKPLVRYKLVIASSSFLRNGCGRIDSDGMRIAFVTTEYISEPLFAGGLANYTYRVARALRELGHDVEVFVPGHRWQALDPTHNCQPNETYVKLAVGRDYADVPPVRGTYKGTTDRTLTVEVKVEKRD